MGTVGVPLKSVKGEFTRTIGTITSEGEGTLLALSQGGSDCTATKPDRVSYWAKYT